MKIAAAILSMMLPCLSQEETAVVRFINGDRLSGDLLALNRETLSWKSRLLNQPAAFDIHDVLELELPVGSPPTAAPKATHEAIITLSNNDSIRGQLVGISDSEIRLSTWYAEELVLRRLNVKSAKINSINEIHYRGPNSIEEWKQDQGNAWSFKNGALLCESPGGIAREIDFPDECVISFQATWRGTFRPRMVFFSKNTGAPSAPESGYELVFQGISIYLKKVGTNIRLGQPSHVGALREKEHARIGIKANLKSGKFALYVDEEIVAVWQDNAIDRESLGKGLHLISQDTSSLRISELEVSSWDGLIEDMPDRNVRLQDFEGRFEFPNGNIRPEKPAVEPIPAGRMLLRNGDSIEGEVTGIENEDITIKTQFAEVKIPVVRLKNLAISNDSMETAKRESGDVQATLADGSRIVFRLDQVEEDVIVGFSQNFGTARFRKDAFKRIKFNLYPTNGISLHPKEDW
jgi:hypothetical protein